MSLSYWCIIVELWPIAQSNDLKLLVFNCIRVTANSSVSNEPELLVFNCVGVMANSME